MEGRTKVRDRADAEALLKAWSSSGLSLPAFSAKSTGAQASDAARSPRHPGARCRPLRAAGQDQLARRCVRHPFLTKPRIHDGVPRVVTESRPQDLDFQEAGLRRSAGDHTSMATSGGCIMRFWVMAAAGLVGCLPPAAGDPCTQDEDCGEFMVCAPAALDGVDAVCGSAAQSEAAETMLGRGSRRSERR